ncbi:hypothetical protein BDV24DRAFT_146085 [Aspergillus arachidicola]|uniref:Uncharacterized protein n=1 Tax=Aspergillus arachidicola TaxID=656916 RepID=A0A5N6XNL3_9EURO|nr:hypothetical protein BDV24DRAFT_146085 [Aspergillus arachidicola]
MGISSFQDQLSQVGETPSSETANLRPRGIPSERSDRGYKPKSAIGSWSDCLEGRRGWSRGPM